MYKNPLVRGGSKLKKMKYAQFTALSFFMNYQDNVFYSTLVHGNSRQIVLNMHKLQFLVYYLKHFFLISRGTLTRGSKPGLHGTPGGGGCTFDKMVAMSGRGTAQSSYDERRSSPSYDESSDALCRALPNLPLGGDGFPSDFTYISNGKDFPSSHGHGSLSIDFGSDGYEVPSSLDGSPNNSVLAVNSAVSIPITRVWKISCETTKTKLTIKSDLRLIYLPTLSFNDFHLHGGAFL